MDCKGIFFDLYGTLLLYGDMRAAWEDWLAAFHGELTGAGFDVDRGRLTEHLDGILSKPEPHASTRGRTVLERRIVASCAQLDFHLSETQVARLADAVVHAWQQHVSMDPHAISVLSHLSRTHRLALVSNFDHEIHVHGLLRDLELTAHFESVVISGEVGVKKPDPRIFEGALTATGLRPEEVVYVGDDEVDVHAARSAGMRPVRIRRRTDAEPIAHDFRKAGHQQTDAAPSSAPDVTEIRCLTELVAGAVR